MLILPKSPAGKFSPVGVKPGWAKNFCLVLALAVFVGCFCLPSPSFAVFGDGPESEAEPVLVEIILEGNSRTNDTFILREMGLKTGQPFTRERMDEVWDHLEDMGCFAFVDMEYDDSEPDQVILIVTLEEEDTLGYGPLLRYSQRHKYYVGAWAENTNLRGQGETLRADLSMLYIQRASLAWTRPWFLGKKGLQMRAVVRGEQADFVYRPFRYRKANLDLSLRWTARQPFFLVTEMDYGIFQIRDEFSWQLPYRGVGSSAGDESFAIETQPRLALWAAIGMDTRSNPWYPSQGVFAQATVKRWESSYFTSYTEGSLDLRGFLPLPKGHHLLALRAWGRLTDAPTQLDNICFFGGSQTVRGYHPDSREGDEAYLLTAEYRLPITMMRISPQGDLAGVGVHAFADAGDTWFHGADPAEAMQSWGTGIHLNIDRMQIRFEAARTRGGDWSFEFGDVMTF
ncbi:MAG: BamA/TamA family outer membrane protein [Gemmatimonadales bacterium]|nr:BamA/TamA family outer membrane protein [Gemmatimonadales bacterium]